MAEHVTGEIVHPIDRREFLGMLAAGLAASKLPTELLGAQRKRPNLIFILADDLGYGDLSAFGRPDYRTPNLDRLCAEGIRFTDAYSAAAVCTPTRASFMTGRYPARLSPGLQQPMSWVNEKDGLAPELPTIASLLKQADYETALVGKWHLGYLPDFGPLRHGFDEFFGILSGGVGYFSHRDANGKHDLHEGLASVQKVGYLTDVLTDRAVSYVSRRRTKPFYLSLHYTAPHWPWEEASHRESGDTLRRDMTKGGSPRIFAEMVRSLDTGVGRVMKALASTGIERDTLMIFTSDNGGERYSYNWPHSFDKGLLWEGGIRVPAAARWPGTIPPRRVTDQVALTFDWTATLLSAAQAAADPAHPLDGIDLLPVCRGTRPAAERTVFWRQPFLRYRSAPAMDAVRSGQWKYLKSENREYLFDLAVDPGEKADRSQDQPTILARLRDEFGKWDAGLPPRG